MPKFFLTKDCISDESVFITGEDARHIALSLRMACGDELAVTDGECDYRCTLTDIRPDSVSGKIEEVKKISCEPPYKVTLLQAMPKSDKMDLIVKRCVECGVYRIIPFISSRCICRPDEKSLANKTARWNKIAKESSMQSGRGIIPQVDQAKDFATALGCCESKDALKLFFYEGTDVIPLPKILGKYDSPPDDIVVAVGSEGGFSREEYLEAKEAGYIPAGLGKRILRCENAPAVALSCISYQFEM